MTADAASVIVYLRRQGIFRRGIVKLCGGE